MKTDKNNSQIPFWMRYIKWSCVCINIFILDLSKITFPAQTKSIFATLHISKLHFRRMLEVNLIFFIWRKKKWDGKKKNSTYLTKWRFQSFCNFFCSLSLHIFLAITMINITIKMIKRQPKSNLDSATNIKRIKRNRAWANSSRTFHGKLYQTSNENDAGAQFLQ